MAIKQKGSKVGKIPGLVKSVAGSFHSNYIKTLSEDDLPENWIPSTNRAINYIVGDPRKGAFPQGRLIEIFGKKSSGKSLMLYDAGANCQKMNGIFVLVDSENAIHKGFAEHVGLDLSTTIYAAIKPVEEILDFVCSTIEKLRKKKFTGPILIGWDSIAASKTLRSLKHNYSEEKSDMGHKAQVLSSSMGDVCDLLAKENSTFIVLNQIRHKIGVMFGSNETTPGGEAIPFFASVRIEVRKTKKLLSGKRIIGHENIIYVEKNRVRPPHGKAIIDIYSDRVGMRYGLDKWSGLIDCLLIDEVIKKKGSKNSRTYQLIGDKSIKFTQQTIGKNWNYILQAIPKDIYKKKKGKKNEKNKKRKKSSINN